MHKSELYVWYIIDHNWMTEYIYKKWKRVLQSSLQALLKFHIISPFFVFKILSKKKKHTVHLADESVLLKSKADLVKSGWRSRLPPWKLGIPSRFANAYGDRVTGMSRTSTSRRRSKTCGISLLLGEKGGKVHGDWWFSGHVLVFQKKCITS